MSASSALTFGARDAAPVAATGDVCLTRADIRALADALAARISEQGIARVMVASDDPKQILRAIDACARAGADLYIAHTNLSAEHREEIIASHKIGLVVGERDEARSAENGLRSERPRIFMMTSGTTGLPKIATHSLESLLSKVKAGASVNANRDGKWLLTYQPTGFAGIQVILTAALTGGVVVSPAERTPSGFYEAAKRWQVTQISGTATFWRSFLMIATPEDLQLKQITFGGEAADQATLDRVKKAFPGARISHIYASTEAGVVYAVHDGMEGFPADWLEKDLGGKQVRIRDGFLQIKSPNLMRGYAGADNQPILDDGWLATADRCEVRGDRVYVLGRDDTTINVGGSKVYPLAVETYLLKLPGVVEARVFGEKNPISGFLVAAEVVVAPEEDKMEARTRVLAACREGLAQYQVPRILKIVDRIAVKASGKKG